jgi:hypothetical protein
MQGWGDRPHGWLHHCPALSSSTLGSDDTSETGSYLDAATEKLSAKLKATSSLFVRDCHLLPIAQMKDLQ